MRELRWMRRELPPSELSKAIKLRKTGYPLQYILKSQPFHRFDIYCDENALIPRWETEEWTLKLAEKLKHQKVSKVLDICTGTGCILFTLCDILKCSGIGLDKSALALKTFEKNRQLLNMQHKTSKLHMSLFDPLPNEARSCDLVVANPPYVLNKMDVDKEVLFEPEMALYEVDGMWEALVKRILETNATKAVVEVGNKSQIKRLVELFAGGGWKAEGERDSGGRWRTVWAQRRTK